MESEVPDADDVDPETFDKYLGAELFLPRVMDVSNARVVPRARGEHEWPVGRGNANPILETREYILWSLVMGNNLNTEPM